MKRALGLAAAGWLAVALGLPAPSARAGGWDRPDLMNLDGSQFTADDTRQRLWATAADGAKNLVGGSFYGFKTVGDRVKRRQVGLVWWSLEDPDKIQRTDRKFTFIQKGGACRVGGSAWILNLNTGVVTGSSSDSAVAEDCSGWVRITGVPPNEPRRARWMFQSSEGILALLDMEETWELQIRNLLKQPDDVTVIRAKDSDR